MADSILFAVEVSQREPEATGEPRVAARFVNAVVMSAAGSGSRWLRELQQTHALKERSMPRISEPSKKLIAAVKPAPTPVKPAAVIDVAGVARKLFKRDELSLGKGLKPHAPVIPLFPGPLFNKHNQRVALHLKDTVTKLQSKVDALEPLPAADAPRRGKDGRYVAPNGDPLVRVALSHTDLAPGTSTTRYALVNPRTNEVYFGTDNRGCFNNSTTFRGPVELPKSQRFAGKEFTTAQVRSFERFAALGAALDSFKKKPLAERVDAMLKKGSLHFDQPAPKPGDVLSEKVIKSEHPFTYYAVQLASEPGKVVIKQVLTGGFVPAEPGAGSYSQPIPV